MSLCFLPSNRDYQVAVNSLFLCQNSYSVTLLFTYFTDQNRGYSILFALSSCCRQENILKYSLNLQRSRREEKEKVESAEEIQPNIPAKIGAESHVPADIHRDILIRFPAKSLVRFKSVCKRWKEMISQPAFTKDFVQQRRSKIRIVYQIPQSDESSDDNCLYKLEENNGLRTRKAVSLPFQEKFFFARKSCNSVILFEDFLNGRLFVYDAMSHRQKLLPCIPRFEANMLSCHRQFNLVNCHYSLVYDGSSQKYKVFVFSHDLKYNVVELCYIYSFSFDDKRWWEFDNWRVSKPPFRQMTKSTYSPGIALKGMLYRIAYIDDPYHPAPQAFIQPIDIATEIFMASIQVPCQPHEDNFPVNNYNLLEMKGSLCLMNPASEIELDIWLLRDSVQGRWIKQHSISLLYIVDLPISLTSFFEDNFYPWLVVETPESNLTHIIVSHLNSTLYWYNLESKEMRPIDLEFDLDFSPFQSSIIPLMN